MDVGAQQKRVRFEFTGDGMEMALLMLKNLFFSIITIGIYRAWATTNTRRYIWGHMTFMGDRANYVGTGRELFNGWMKLGLILIVGAFLVNILKLVFEPLSIIIFVVYVTIFAVARYSGLRYRLSRTLWRQVRFGVDKDKEMTKEFLKVYFTGVFLNVITLSIYYPWFKNNVRKFLTNKSRMGNSHFSYTGDGGEYAWIFWSGLALSVLTLGIYSPWWIADLTAFRFSNTKFMGTSFRFDLPGVELFKYAIVAFLVSILTMGLAAPWMFVWGLKLFAKHTSLDVAPDFSLVLNRASDGSALADDIVAGYDLDLGI